MDLYAVQSNVIRRLSKNEYKLLKEMCVYSNNLYNIALCNVMHQFANEHTRLSYVDNYHICKNTESYKLLAASVAQQTLRAVERTFTRYANNLKKSKSNCGKSKYIKPPKCRENGGMFPLVFSTNNIYILNGFITIPLSRAFRTIHPNVKRIAIKFPKHLENKTIKEVRILPRNRGKYFKIQYVYKIDKEPLSLNKDNVLSVDFGIDNLATCVSTIGTPFIMDGRKLKSINHQWNKEIARLRSISMKQGLKTTNRIQKITTKRNNRINDCIKKTARYIVNYCVKNDIGSLVVGYTKGLKKSRSIGKVNNQNLIQIPFYALRKQLSFLCTKYGIEYLEQEESYTSKSSFIDDDVLPRFDFKQPYKGKFSGKRIYRGLYKSANGILINADVNGAANIMRKCKQNVNYDRLCKGFLANPVRIRLI